MVLGQPLIITKCLFEENCHPRKMCARNSVINTSEFKNETTVLLGKQ